jgi:hypothetical protein
VAGFGWWVSVPIDQIRARFARTFLLGLVAEAGKPEGLHEELAPLAPEVRAVRHSPTPCRHARSEIATLPRRTVRHLLSTPLGRTVRYLPYAFKPRTCRRPGLQACPRPIGPSGEGRAPGRVRLAPLDYRTRPIWRPLPEVARRSRPTPMPTARGPQRKETARSLTCELSWPLTMRCVCRAAASPSSIYRGNPRY